MTGLLTRRPDLYVGVLVALGFVNAAIIAACSFLARDAEIPPDLESFRLYGTMLTIAMMIGLMAALLILPMVAGSAAKKQIDIERSQRPRKLVTEVIYTIVAASLAIAVPEFIVQLPPVGVLLAGAPWLSLARHAGIRRLEHALKGEIAA